MPPNAILAEPSARDNRPNEAAIARISVPWRLSTLIIWSKNTPLLMLRLSIRPITAARLLGLARLNTLKHEWPVKHIHLAPFRAIHLRQASNLTPQEAARALRLARMALINSVDGFLDRNILRLRLFLMGQVRPMRTDDILALFSWIFVGNTLFILVGTTTFLSVMLVLANSFSFQEKLAEMVSESLTGQTGWNINFESAIVPRWSDGMIRLSNVKAVCTGDTWRAFKAKEHAKGSNTPLQEDQVDCNFTYWDISIEALDIDISLWRWLDGRGLLQSARFKGVRGDVLREHITWPDDWEPKRREPLFGDFDMDSVVFEDLLLTIHNPNFRPFTVSVFQASLPRLRKQWMLYDMMCADAIVGMMDNCLFSVHKPQTIDLNRQKDLENKWSKVRHLKVSGIPIGHLNSSATGPFHWITKGSIDLDMHMLVPYREKDDALDHILDEIDVLRHNVVKKLEKAIGHDLEKADSFSLKHFRRYGKAPLPFHDEKNAAKPTDGELLFISAIQINDLKASIPASTPDLSYMNQALIRPVVAYMNANRTKITLSSNAQMDIVPLLLT